VPRGNSRGSTSVAALLLACSVLAAPGESDPDGAVIMARSTAANEVDWVAAPAYAYEERLRDDAGTRTYDVFLLLGTPYQRLTSVDGEPLSAQQEKREDQKFLQERAKRMAESDRQRARRRLAYQKDRGRVHRILEELPQAFDYRLTAKRPLAPRMVYILRATPKAGYHPPNAEAEVLTGMTGEFWIDTRTYQCVRALMKVLRPVGIDGFLARVQPGTEFEIEQMPVDDGVWLPQHFEIRSHTSVLVLFHQHTFEDHTFSNYHKSSGFDP
jgi:hypothetical protein